ncbi:MAG TPA: hypothetical protein VMZ22_01680 [Acidimicrobiales bacterium]|nr:hypothetical protein [Acidimicrobiales bacterium]
MSEQDQDHIHGDGCDHDHDLDDGLDDGLDYVPSSPEVLADRRSRLTATLEAISLEDLNAHLQTAPPQVRHALTQRLNVRLDPKFVKGGIGKLIRTRLRNLSPTKQVEMAAELTAGLDHDSSEFLGEAFNLPSTQDLSRLVDHLLEKHQPVMVRTYFACTAAADAPVASELDALLLHDPRLSVPG